MHKSNIKNTIFRFVHFCEERAIFTRVKWAIISGVFRGEPRGAIAPVSTFLGAANLTGNFFF